MVTAELRRDPITGRAVIIDRSTDKRRDDFLLEPVRVGDPAASCPLCEGHEAETGAEVLAWRDGGSADGPEWSVRVVPSRQPILRIEGGLDVRTGGLFETRDGLGAHEVVIETPEHDRPLQALSAERVWRVLWAWRSRMQDLKRDTRFASIVVSKNHGRASGARRDHAHSQIVAYPLVPPALAEKVRGGTEHLTAHGRCLFCDLLDAELADGRRIVCDGDIVVIAPFASRVPFETWLLPRAHAPRFEDVSDEMLTALAAQMIRTLSAIDWALERPAYNLILHSAPLGGEVDQAFHWHIEILPRVTRVGGQEWSSGVFRNPVSPEEAADALRKSV